MADIHTTDNETKTNIVDSGIGAVMGEDEYLLMGAAGGDIGKMASSDSPPLKPSNVLQLQRKLGNQTTMNILARKAQTGDTGQSATTPFAGLKMVTPNIIQREPEDEDADGAISRQDGLDEADVNPDAAVELDGSDQENQDDSNEIDQVIDEAKGIQIIQPMDTMDSDIDANDNIQMIDEDEDNNDGFIGQNQGNTPTTQNQGVVLSDDDEDAGDDVNVIDSIDTDYDDNSNKNDDNLASPVSTGQNTVIKQKGKHKQRQGVHIKGHQLASESLGGAAMQTGIDASRNVTTGIQMAEAVDAVKAASSFKGALEGISDTASDAGSEGVTGFLGQLTDVFSVPPLNVVLPVVAMIFRIHAARVKHKHMKAYKGLMAANNGDKSKAKKRSTKLADKGTIGAYGFAKTKRGFWLRVAKAAISVGQVISRLITVLSGGTTAFVTETIALAGSLSNGVIKMAQSLKGIYKMIIGKRGKRRVESANWIVDAAIDGDEEMLKFMLDGEALSNTWMFMRHQKYIDYAEAPDDKTKLANYAVLAKRPKTTQELKHYLEIAEKENVLGGVKNQVAIMTKST